MQKPVIACLDLEGVLVPEIWINVALKTGIEELKVTTREMPDYDALMKRRLAILDQHKLTITDIQSVIDKMGPLARLSSRKDLEQLVADFEEAKKKGQIPPDVEPKL